MAEHLAPTSCHLFDQPCAKHKQSGGGAHATPARTSDEVEPEARDTRGVRAFVSGQ